MVVLSGSVSAQQGTQDEKELVIKVFSLSNARASELVDVVDAVLGNAIVGVAVDPRTNSLIVRARPDDAAVLEALLMKLDEHPPQDAPAPPLTDAADNQGGQATDHIGIQSGVAGAAVLMELIPNGTRVNEGDLLAELDDSQLIEELQTLKVELAELKAGSVVEAEETSVLADLAETVKVGELEILTAELRVKQVEAEMKVELIVLEGEISLAKKTLDLLLSRQKGVEERAKTGNVPPEEVQTIALEVARFETTFEVAMAKHELFTEVIEPLRLSEAKLELDRAKTGVERAKREAELRAKEARSQLDAIRAHVRLKANQMARLEEQIAKCKIFAPSSGVVRIGQPSIIREGATVRQGQRLIYLELESAPAR